jgi:hypothetical protein
VAESPDAIPLTVRAGSDIELELATLACRTAVNAGEPLPSKQRVGGSSPSRRALLSLEKSAILSIISGSQSCRNSVWLYAILGIR